MTWNQWQEPAGGAEEEPAVDTDWSDYSKAQLQAELESRGLAKSGTKDELIARLQESD